MTGSHRYQREDLHFMPEAARAKLDPGPRLAYVLSLATLLFLSVMALWAQQATLDVVTRAKGQMVAAPPADGSGDRDGAENGLRIIALVEEHDLAALQPGQSAAVELAAYDPSIYGRFSATLAQIATQPIKGKNGITKHEITLRLESNRLTFYDKNKILLPGTSATAEILTGKTTVLNAVLRPFRRGSVPSARAG